MINAPTTGIPAECNCCTLEYQERAGAGRTTRPRAVALCPLLTQLPALAASAVPPSRAVTAGTVS